VPQNVTSHSVYDSEYPDTSDSIFVRIWNYRNVVANVVSEVTESDHTAIVSDSRLVILETKE